MNKVELKRQLVQAGIAVNDDKVKKSDIKKFLASVKKSDKK